MTTGQDNLPVKHEDLVSSPSSAPSAPNPFARAANITVSVPESVEIRLVDASALSDYEVWSLTTSILSSAVIGFFVAFCQAATGTGQSLLWTALVFLLLTVISGLMALSKKRRLTKNTRKMSFRIGEPIS